MKSPASMKPTANLKSLLTLLSCFIVSLTPLNGTATEPLPHTFLDEKGKAVAANARCATIQESDLTWELKTDDGGIHDKDNVYRWGGTGAEKTGTIFFDDWNSLINAANTENLCGFDDWRVPTIDELKTLVADTNKKPVIDTRIFSLTLAVPYWSVSTYQHYPEHAQTVDFSTGAANYYNGFRGDRLPLRLVRSNKVSSNKASSVKSK